MRSCCMQVCLIRIKQLTFGSLVRNGASTHEEASGIKSAHRCSIQFSLGEL